MATPTVKLRTTGTHFTCTKSEHCLLEVLELHAIEVEYQCRSGYCGACRLKLVKGKVAYCQPPPLALINDGEILPCCCMPLTDIELDI